MERWEKQIRNSKPDRIPEETEKGGMEKWKEEKGAQKRGEKEGRRKETMKGRKEREER